MPELAFSGAVFFRGGEENRPAWIDKVSLRHVAPGSTITPKHAGPNWTGYWIWCKDNLGTDNCTAWLTRSFDIPSDVVDATMQLTCDDSYSVFINGKKVADNHDKRETWRSPSTIGIAWALQIGRNIILVEARNNAGN